LIEDEGPTMSPEEMYVGRVSSALERMLRDQGDEWRAEAREIDRRLFQADMLWGHGDYRTEDLQTFVLRVTELNCVLLDESNLRELMHRGWPPESAESALELIENLLP